MFLFFLLKTAMMQWLVSNWWCQPTWNQRVVCSIKPGLIRCCRLSSNSLFRLKLLLGFIDSSSGWQMGIFHTMLLYKMLEKAQNKTKKWNKSHWNGAGIQRRNADARPNNNNSNNNNSNSSSSSKFSIVVVVLKQSWEMATSRQQSDAQVA